MEEIGYEDVVQIQMAQDTVQLQDLVIMTIFCGSEILWLFFKDIFVCREVTQRDLQITVP